MMRSLIIGLVLAMISVPSVGFGDMSSETSNGAVAPEPPREFVDSVEQPSSGRTLRVNAGGNFQKALDEADLGDVIVLESGATFDGHFSLPNKKRGAGWITIRSSGVEKNFPPAGTRVSPAQAPLMAVLTTWRGDGVVMAEKGAHHYRFIGIEVRPHEGNYVFSLLWFGNNRERSLDELPHHIIVDRCYIHGDPQKGSRRGVSMNGRHLAVIDSYISDFKDPREDSQAILGWGGSGPFKIVNNYLEGAGENLMFGGGDPFIQGLVPSDIEIRRNHMAKPLSWKRGEPNYDGSSWSIKNIFELKNARRVWFDGNILEYNWEAAQSGFAVLFTVRNQQGRAPWSAVEDVQFTNNIIRHSGSGINLMGHDNNRAWNDSVETKRILIKNNVWEDIGGSRWGGRGILFQLMESTSDVVIENNTGRQTGHLVFGLGPPHKGFVFKNNAAPHNEFGIFGNAIGVGTKAIEAYFPDAVVVGNIIAGGDKRQYPEGNVFPSSLESVMGAPQHAAATFSKASQHRLSTTDAGVKIKELCLALGSYSDREPMCHMEADVPGK
jgi:hypothetical protein